MRISLQINEILLQIIQVNIFFTLILFKNILVWKIHVLPLHSSSLFFHFFSPYFFFLSFLAIIILLYITIARRVTPCRECVFIVKILHYCIVLRTTSTENGHEHEHRNLMYYLINFSGKINSIFLTQDNDAILSINFSSELFMFCFHELYYF